MNRLRQFAFPLSLAVILGALSAWLGQASQISIEEITLNPKEPQYLIAQAAAKHYDSAGSLQQQLVSPKAWQLPDQKNVYFEQPDLRIWTQERAEYHVTAQQARYELASKKIFFEQEVTLDKSADAQRDAAQVRTSQLTVDTVRKIAETPAAVHYRYGNSQGSAQGMTYDYQNGQLNLPAQVKALIYDTDSQR